MYRDQQSILDKIQQISESVINDNTHHTDKVAHWPKQAIDTLRHEGLAGLTIPIEYGGLGQGTETLAKVSEQIGQYCSHTAVCFGMHAVASATIASKATTHQHQNYLTPICEGRHITTIALHEASSGSQFYLPQTRMQYHSATQYNINGSKSFVINGAQADSYIISAVADNSAQPNEQFNCFIVDGNSTGIQWAKEANAPSLYGHSRQHLTLSDVKIPSENILGQYGDQIWYIFNVITPYFLAAMAGTYLGITRAALDKLITHIKHREFSFNGRPLASSSVIQYQLGQLWAQYARSRALVYQATACYDSNQEHQLIDLFAAKAEAADVMLHIINESMTLCGHDAYDKEATLEQLLREARAAHLISPTTDILRIWTGRSILEQPLLTDT